jgi:MoaA/NifB/PqqE/SkfB family radical SAM enzyme
MDLRYSKLKVFHYPEKLASLARESDEIRPPIHVRIKPTNVCAHHCWYCAYRYDDLQLGKDIDLREVIPRDKMMEIIDDLIEMGVQAVTFSGGGDPFYYPHLAETARKLADSPIRFASLTNGARLEGEKAEIFSQHASWVRISIDGWDPVSYAKYRGVKETEFDRVLNNMRNFTALKGQCRLGISLIVDKDNAAHVHQQVAMAKSVGAASIKVSPAIVSDHGLDNNEYHAPFFDEVHAQIMQAKEDFEKDGFEVYHAYHRQDVVFDKEYHWCPYLQILCVIGADQRVYACQDKAYNLDSGLLGSIQETRFKDFWMNNKDKFFGINPARHCNHHCVADSKNKLVLEYLGAGAEHGEFV